ncbi:MAG: hypothetical protein VW498_02025 [Candidatus Thalassarchaeaceae archaeon]
MRMRTDLKSYFQGMRKGRNIALHAQGGFRRRPGTVYKAVLENPSVLHEFSFGQGQSYIFAFSDTKLTIYNGSGTLVTTLTSCPWTSAELNELTLTSSADTTIVCHQNFAPQYVLRTGASSFTRQDFPFEEDSSGAPKKQPYYKFAADSVTLTPSATTGSITVTTSADHWVSDHAGTIIRYKGKEILLDSFSSTTVMNATVRETLSGTSADTDWEEQTFSDVTGYPRACTFHDQRLFFAGSTDRPDGFWGSQTNAFFNFDVGTAQDDEAIDVTVTGDRVAEIRHLVATRHMQVFTNGAELFVPQSQANPLTPTNVSFIQQTPYGCSQDVNPLKFDGATLFMQRTGKTIREYLFSDVEQAYTSGAVSLRSNHLIGTAVDSAVMLGTEDRPEQFAFFVKSDGGVAVFHSVRNEQMAGWVLWTTDGNVKSMTSCEDNVFWAVERTINGSTALWLEMLDWDVTLDATEEFAADTNRVINGTFDTDTDWGKGTGWTIGGGTASCDGTQTSASNINQSLTTVNGNTYQVKFTVSNRTAGTITPKISTASGTAVSADGTYIVYITTVSGSTLELEADSDFVGDIDDVSVVEVTKSYTAAHLPSTEVEVTTNHAAQHAGTYTSDGSGIVTTDEFLNGADVGLNYSITAETMPVDAVIRQVGAVTGEKKRISRVVVSLVNTQSLTLSDNKLVLAQSNDDFSNPPTAANGDYQFFMLGWAGDPTVTFSQGEPLPLTVLGLYVEVTA